MAKYLLTHDLGTSSDKATLYAANGELLAHSEQSYPVYYAEGGILRSKMQWTGGMPFAIITEYC